MAALPFNHLTISHSSMSRTLWIVLGIIAVLLLWVWSGYNGLIGSQGNVQAEWANVETTYQRRFDLVPNLVNTVKGAANFEQQTLLSVTEARTKWLNASAGASADPTAARTAQVAAAQQFDSALARLLVTVEAYPQIQGTQAFRDLMTQLEGTENRIAVARRDYNQAVMRYNIRVRRFPGNILAGVFGFGTEESFESQPESENAPAVNF